MKPDDPDGSVLAEFVSLPGDNWQADDIVRAGPADAVWRIDGDPHWCDGDWETGGRLYLIRLVPVDPHDVPLDARVVELPVPKTVVPPVIA